ncbi:hypothetical protein DFH09DRAFT_1313499 [Mycena vulgaris]|nr:hypothetical protein DFH09DRAFT_1313499 [Mycena vulgaris]
MPTDFETPRASAIQNNAPPALEQYFSHRIFHHAHEPEGAKIPTDVISAVDDAVFRYWQRRENGEEEECDPTFAAAPHSEYYGKVTLANGQEVHYSLAKNNFQVHKNKLTGRPFSLLGHTLCITVTLPKDPNVRWEYEVPYPSNDCLHREMIAMAPHDPPTDDEIGFPMHVTSHAPPMLTFRERVRERLMRRGMVRPSDLPRSNSEDSSLGSGSSSYETVESVGSATTSQGSSLVAVLLEDVAKRSEEGLEQLELLKDSGRTLLADARDVEAVPALHSVDLNDGASDASSESYHAGLCPICFESDHEPVACIPLPPLESTPVAVAPVVLSPPPIEDAERARVLDRVLESARLPTVRALLSLPAPFAARYLRLMDAATRVQKEIADFADGLSGDQAEKERILDEMTRELTAAMDTITDEVVEAGSTDQSSATGSSQPGSGDPLPSTDFDASQPSAPTSGDSWSSSASIVSSPSTESDVVFAPAPLRPARFTSPLSERATTDEAGARIFISTGDEGKLSRSSQDPVAPASERSSSPVMIDEAIDRVNATEPIRETPPERVAAPAPESQGQGNSVQHDPAFYALSAEEQQSILEKWIRAGKDHQEEHFINEDLVGGAPIPSNAIRMERLELLSQLSVDVQPPSDVPPPPPDFAQTKTPLEFDEPTFPQQELANMSTGENTGPNLSDLAESGEAGSKRKVPDGERLGEFQEGPRKRFPIHLATPEVVRYFAGIRLAFLEGARRIEGAVWHRYGIDENDLPSGFVKHPLLFDVEAAKIRAVYGVLIRHQRYETAALLYDVLNLRLRDDYALSHLLNASHLESQLPSGYIRYWELLPYPASMRYSSDSDSDSDESHDDSDSDWDAPGLQYPESADESPRPLDIQAAEQALSAGWETMPPTPPALRLATTLTPLACMGALVCPPILFMFAAWKMGQSVCPSATLDDLEHLGSAMAGVSLDRVLQSVPPVFLISALNLCFLPSPVV